MMDDGRVRARPTMTAAIDGGPSDAADMTLARAVVAAEPLAATLAP